MGKAVYPTKEDTKNIIEYDDRYSNKDYTMGKLYAEKGLQNLIIYNSCFSKETPDDTVFPKDMTGVIFYNCNLDNCVIPAGNTVVGGATRRFRIQTDRNDWIIDKDDKPIEPLNKEDYINLGLSIDPEDLPLEMMTENIIEVKTKELNAEKEVL